MQNSDQAYRVHSFFLSDLPQLTCWQKSSFKSFASNFFQTLNFYGSVIIFPNIGTAIWRIDGELSVFTRKTKDFVNGNADYEEKWHFCPGTNTHDTVGTNMPWSWIIFSPSPTLEIVFLIWQMDKNPFSNG